MNLSGSVVVVTGGASGIGAAITEELRAHDPQAIVVLDVEHPLSTSPSSAVDFHDVDVSDEAALRSALYSVVDKYGAIDVMLQCAGVFVGGGLEVEDAAWWRSFDVNVMAHLYGARAVLPAMLDREQGHIVNVCSAAGLLSDPGAAPYTASKHAAVALSEWLTLACRETGVGVTTVCPEAVETPMLGTVREQLGPEGGVFVGEALDAMAVARLILGAVVQGEAYVYTHDGTHAKERDRAADRTSWLAAQPALYDIRVIGGSSSV